MKNVFRIYKRDVKTIVTNWAALIMVVILIVIPSLYSLINIKACWDPYGNTGGLKVAVVNEDAGTVFKESEMNMGDELVNKLKDNTKLGWNFVTKEEAIEGILEEKYYAMIEIPEDFSESVVSVVEKNVKKPKLKYTINEKKNPIAPKITDTGVKTVKGQLDDTIVKIISGAIFRVCNEVGFDFENNRSDIRRIVDSVYELDDKMPDLEYALNGATDGIDKAADILDKGSSMIPTVSDMLDSVDDFLGNSNEFLDTTQSELDSTYDVVKEDLVMAEGVLDTSIITINNVNENVLPETAKKGLIVVSESLNAASTTIEDITSKLDGIRKFLDKATDIEVMQVKNIDSILAHAELDDENLIETAALSNNTALAGEEQPEGSDSTEVQGPPAQVAEDGSTVVDNNSSSNEIQEEANPSEDTSSLAGNTDSQGSSNTGAVEAPEQSESEAIAEEADTENSAVDMVRENGDRLTAIINGGIDAINDAKKDLNNTNKKLKNLIADLEKADNNIKTALDRINQKIQDLENGKEIEIQNINDITKILEDVHKFVVNTLDSYDSELIPTINGGFDYVRKISDKGTILLSQGRDLLPDVDNLFGKFLNITNLSNEQLVSLNEKFPDVREKVSKLAAKLRSLDEEDQIDEILELITNNWEDQSNFLASPVEIVDNRLFPWPNYGSTATPFYIVLCFWVGGILGSALLNFKAKPLGEDIVIRPYEMYLGKLLLFLTVAILQALVASIGALVLLKVYAVHPVMFVLYSVFISSVFCILIYTAASLFDDVGKSIMVFLLVLQMAGTSGNFPIQVNPQFFQMLYPALPFTYAVSGMRQIMAGIVYPILIKDTLILSAYMGAFFVFGILFKGIANKTTDKIVDKLLSSGILRH